MRKFYMYAYMVMGTVYLVAAFISPRDIDMTPGWTLFALGQIAYMLNYK